MDQAQTFGTAILILSTIGFLWLLKLIVLDRTPRPRPPVAPVVPMRPTGYPQISDYERQLAHANGRHRRAA